MRMTDGQQVPPNEKNSASDTPKMASPWLLKHGYKPKDWTKRLARAYVAFVRDTEFLVRLPGVRPSPMFIMMWRMTTGV